MTEENHVFQVSAQELRYLKELALGNEALDSLLNSKLSTSGHGATISLTRVKAEQLRASLTVRLAQAGFDRQYSPNNEGQMLETLIDRFYL